MDFKVGDKVIIDGGCNVRMHIRKPLIPIETIVEIVHIANTAVTIKLPEKYEGLGWRWPEKGFHRKLYLPYSVSSIYKAIECKHCGLKVGEGKCIYCGYENNEEG